MGLDCNTEKLRDARIQWDHGDSSSKRNEKQFELAGLRIIRVLLELLGSNLPC